MDSSAFSAWRKRVGLTQEELAERWARVTLVSETEVAIAEADKTAAAEREGPRSGAIT